MTNQTAKFRHYRIQQTGSLSVIAKGDPQPATYDIGIVEVGPDRDFAGYFVEIEILGGERIIGVDDNSMRLALGRLQGRIYLRGIRLDCVALSGQWYESGLSENSGWGYYGSSQRLIHMMSPMPDETTGPALDRMIRNVVGRMFARQ